MSTAWTLPQVPAGPSGLAARLMAGAPGADLSAHLRTWGPLPARPGGLLDQLEASGLRGRGGAGFPIADKLAAMLATRARQRRRPLIVGNGTEGEPLSAKDRLLLQRAPHLVLDGLAVVAAAAGAGEGVICVDRQFRSALAEVERAIDERDAMDPSHSRDPGRVAIRVLAAPHRYLTGQETALVGWLAGGDGRPTQSPPRPTERGVDGRPTLVSNVETLAHAALIARFGAGWFRTAGRPDDPGTTLVTVGGAVNRPGVYEVALGTRIADALSVAGGPQEEPQVVLLGGYAGRWLRPGDLDGPIRTGGGPAAVTVLDRRSCALTESARVVRWLANQSAGQCGPCANGLPAIASAFEAVSAGERSGNALSYLLRWSAMVERRGACGLPDGTVRFVRSCVHVLAAEIVHHRDVGPCPPSGILPTPPTEPWA